MSEHIEQTGHRWQKEFGAFVETTKPTLVVETGVQNGYSTKFILEAMDKINHGRLISIDPDPPYTTPHPRWTLVKKTSHDALVDVFLDAGRFDIFVHDSDHGVECMSFELELAWHLVSPGGWIFSDDITWANHGAWDAFCGRYNLEGLKMGYAGWTQKPSNMGVVQTVGDARDAHKRALALSHVAAVKFGDTPKYGLGK